MAKDSFKILTKDNEGSDIIEYFEKIVDAFSFPMDPEFYFISNSKQKGLIKISKIPDQYSIGLGAQLIVTFNETYFDMITDDKSKTILIEQEIDKIEINLDKGTIKLGKPSIATGIGIVKKYNYEEVEKAIELEKLLEKQLDGKKDGMES